MRTLSEIVQSESGLRRIFGVVDLESKIIDSATKGIADDLEFKEALKCHFTLPRNKLILT